MAGSVLASRPCGTKISNLFSGKGEKGLKAGDQALYCSEKERQFGNKLPSRRQLRVVNFQEPCPSGQHPW